MADYTVKVTRNIWAIDRPAHVKSEFGAINVQMRLPDEVRWQMAGDPVAFFTAQFEDKKVTLMRRIPKPASWPEG